MSTLQPQVEIRPRVPEEKVSVGDELPVQVESTVHDTRVSEVRHINSVILSLVVYIEEQDERITVSPEHITDGWLAANNI